MLINIECKKEGVSVVLFDSSYDSTLVELNRKYPGNTWKVKTNDNNYSIDLRDKRYRSITI